MTDAVGGTKAESLCDISVTNRRALDEAGRLR
jgi:hypothetical protein